MKGRMPVFEEYLAGSMLANAPSWLIMGITLYIYEIIYIPATTLQVILSVTYLAGGIIGSYLVARRAYRDHERIGMEIGFAAFLINIIFTILSFGNIASQIMTISLIGLVIGGIIGGKLAGRKWKE